MGIVLGAIADDYTGATDLANTLVRNGMRTVQLLGVPEKDVDIGDADAVVVALKSRTAPMHIAVNESLKSANWLLRKGASQLFFKYCSTFDSTKHGNIGPVADALLQLLDAKLAFVCPAFPTTGRTIYNGHLYVGSQLLSESPMKDHPLTPMKQSCLVSLMSGQTANKVGLIPWQIVNQGVEEIQRSAQKLSSKNCTYMVVDALQDADLLSIGQSVKKHQLITGGSGVAIGLPQNYRDQGLIENAKAASMPEVYGKTLVIAGSCSVATRAQINHVKNKWPTYKVDPVSVITSKTLLDDIADWILKQPGDLPVLVYSSAKPSEVSAAQKAHGGEKVGELIERLYGELSVRMVSAGFTRLIIAGGETSGAVAGALGIKSLRIGPEIDPGVPWTEFVSTTPIALALKSGNFGGEAFFEKASNMLP